MNIIVFGVGSIGRRHVGNLISLGYERITCVDPRAESLEQVKKLHPQVTVAADADDALAGGQFDAAFICPPPQHHVPLLERALDHGCHAFVEKPFSLTSDGVAAVLEKAEKKRRIVMTAFNMRYLRHVAKMKQWLDAGRIGRLLSCRIELSSYMPNWHPWEDYRKCFMAYWSSGGGALFDYVHGIDLAQWMCGPINRLSCISQTAALEMETDDVSVLIAQTEQNVVVSFYFDFLDRFSRKSIDLVGADGTMIWRFDTQDTLRCYNVEAAQWTELRTPCDYGHCYVVELKDFFACIEKGKPPATDGWNGLSTQQVLDMALASNREGREIRR